MNNKKQAEDDLYAGLIKAGKLPRATRRLVDEWWLIILNQRRKKL